MQDKSAKFVVKDSGARQGFDSGAVRDTQDGKGRFDLIPPIAEERLAKHYEAGAVKYGDNNFRLGMPIKRYIDSARRHINKYRMGDTEEDHLIAAVWNLIAIVETEYLIELGYLDKKLLDGRYYSKEVLEQIRIEVLERNSKIETINKENS